jgi:hypothetical protein
VQQASQILSTTSNASLSSFLLATVALLDLLVNSAIDSLDKLQVAWTPEEWFNSLVAGIKATTVSISNFALHSGLVTLALTLAQTRCLKPSLARGREQLTESLASKVCFFLGYSRNILFLEADKFSSCITQLLEYLQPRCSPCYVETVQLLWRIDSLSESRCLESIISMQLASPGESTRLVAFEAFGNLWRFTGKLAADSRNREMGSELTLVFADHIQRTRNYRESLSERQCSRCSTASKPKNYRLDERPRLG